MQLPLTTATTKGEPSTSQFHAELDEQNPFAEVFLEEGGDEATAAVLQLAGDSNHADDGKLFERAARKAGDYVRRLEQLETYMAWSKDRIESLSLEVAAVNELSMAWQTIVERNREDLLATRNELVKEREARSTLEQQHESLTTSHLKLASDIRRRAVGVSIDFGTLFPTQHAQLEQLDHQLNGANGDLDLLKCAMQGFQNQFESGVALHW
jgi:ABC-type transporter Mla subunit MlaD